MQSMSDFESVLLRVYTDPRFRNALRKGIADLSQYNLSAQEIAALKNLDFDTLDADGLTPDVGSCGRRA